MLGNDPDQVVPLKRYGSTITDAEHTQIPEIDLPVRPPFPPMRICCSVAERLPAAMFSSSRVRTYRTGRPSRMVKSDAMMRVGLECQLPFETGDGIAPVTTG